MCSRKAQQISEFEALAKLTDENDHYSFIDVRSEGEFTKGHIPGFLSAPILTDDERHAVGITYKQHGSDAALALGHELVHPHKESRIQGWLHNVNQSKSNRGIVACWRGGQRSGIAVEWLRAKGADVVAVEGGYKRLRAQLLAAFNSLPKFLVLSGFTGSGKTNLLRAAKIAEKIDLEKLAEHRGSSFGAFVKGKQPLQATFENRLALALRREISEVLLEDESIAIGSVFLPQIVKKTMGVSGVVILDTTLEKRMENIFQEYVREPLAAGVLPATLCSQYQICLTKISRRLGSHLTSEIQGQITTAFQSTDHSLADHTDWIKSLLTNYYDKSYKYALDRQNREILFRGGYNECQQWIQDRFA